MPGPLGGKTTVGRLRHRVTVQAPAEVPDEFGTPVQSWQAEADVWARVEPVRGDEAMQAGRVQADVTHRVVMRPYTGLSAKKRLVWLGDGGNAVLNVAAVLPMTGDANWLEVWCKVEA